MAELTDQLNQLLEGRADRIGADPQRARPAIHAAVPALLLGNLIGGGRDK